MSRIISYRAAHPTVFAEQLSEAVGLAQKGNRWQVPSHLGQGYLRQVQLSDALFVTEMKCCLREATTFVREPVANVPFYALVAYLNAQPVPQEVGNQTLWLGPDAQHGLFWGSPEIGARTHCAAGVWQTNLTVAVHRDWLLAQHKHGTPLPPAVVSGRPFYYIEPLLPHLRQACLTLQNGLIAHVPSPLRLLGHAHLFLDAVLEQLAGRKPPVVATAVHRDDVEVLLALHASLQQHLDTPPTLIALAEQAGMSASKLQRLFRAVFGRSVYQHYQALRMQHAHHLLTQHNARVAEAARQVGFAHPSHFTRAFKQHFGYLPKEASHDVV